MSTAPADTLAAPPSPRAAGAADLAAVERLLAAADLPTVGVAAILAAHPQDFLVADEPARPGELAGVAGLEVLGRTALLRSVAVAPAWRSHRLGESLVRGLLDEAERRGLDAVYLLTTTADRWFPRFGFAPVERAAVPAEVAASKEFASACPASAVVMARRLSGRRSP